MALVAVVAAKCWQTIADVVECIVVVDTGRSTSVELSFAGDLLHCWRASFAEVAQALYSTGAAHSRRWLIH